MSETALCLWSSLVSSPADDKAKVSVRLDYTLLTCYCKFFMQFTKKRKRKGLHVQSFTFRSIFSSQVNLVLFGSSAQGFITIHVGPFSALDKWWRYNMKLNGTGHIHESLSVHYSLWLTWLPLSAQAWVGAEWTFQPGSRWSLCAWHSAHSQSLLAQPHYQASLQTAHG